MIEIYTGASEYVYFNIYVSDVLTDVDNDVSVRLYEDNILLDTILAEHESVGRYRYLIRPSFTTTERKLQLYWDYVLGGDAVSQKQSLLISTPYATVDEIIKSYPALAEKTLEQIREAERRARIKINTATGQKFSSWEGTIQVYGSNLDKISLPRRMYRLDALQTGGIDLLPYGITLSTSKHYLNTHVERDFYDIKSDTTAKYFFKRNLVYNITGAFGWEEVPEDINLATKILVNDYFCREDEWRQKYVVDISSNDWHIKFDPAVFVSTGNKDVDDLISPYRWHSVMVL